MNRGVMLDCVCLFPPPPAAELSAALDESVCAAGYTRLKSIDDVLLDEMLEWLLPGERCVAICAPQARAQMLYDTNFNQAALTDALARAMPETVLAHFNLQEGTDFTLRVVRAETVLQEYSNAPSFFNWGRCLGKAESVEMQRPDLKALSQAFGTGLNVENLDSLFKTIAARAPRENTDRNDDVKDTRIYDAVQGLARELGLPRLYRFFEGWAKSDLDWEEDNVQNVCAYRNEV